MRSVRLWFKKYGSAKYISHLDLTRCMIRSFRRTDIPIWYTEGFNPHPHLVYGLSLPLGIEAANEAVDIRLSDDSYPNEKILEELNKASVPGIEFFKVEEPVFKCLEIASADYSVSFSVEKETELLNFINEKISDGNITFQKKTKKGALKEINVCDYIKNLSILTDNGKVTMVFNLPAGNEFTINPLSFLSALLENSEYEKISPAVTRTKLLLKDGTEYR